MKKLFLSLLLFLPLIAWADVSPKPEMEFSFIYNTQNKPLIDPLLSEQIQCTDNQCLESKPLGHYGLQKLYCKAGNCFSVAYEYSDFQKLVIAFTDGTKRESNIFPAAHKLRARYNVYVDKDKLTVEPSNVTPDLGAWARADALFSLFLVLLLELIAAAAYLMYTQKSFTILWSVAVANVVTMAVSWILLAWYASDTAFLWIFYVVAEMLIIRLMNIRKLALKDAFMLAITMNVTSYSIGMILSFWLAELFF
ncbi:hypothetical protein [Candidatus Avelusimicrobium luingense]|uniref:hypothetical protein n=1 Tax=Candidatus Avelusimicrobium luingense TaxID=3416211 RepID=UPI003D0C1FEA